MNGNFRANGLKNPVAHPAELIRAVVRVGNYQVCDFEPDIAFMFQPMQSIQDRLEFRIRDAFVEIFCEGFEIDIGRIHRVKEFRSCARADVSCRDSNRMNSQLPAFASRIDGVFSPDDWIVVRKSNAATTRFECCCSDAFRHGQFAQSLNFSRLGDVPVLTELTTQIAACGSERQDRGAGKKVIKRLLFDRVYAEPCAATVSCQFHLTINILADKAKPSIAGLQVTISGAKVAGNSSVGGLVPPFSGCLPVGISGAPCAGNLATADRGCFERICWIHVWRSRIRIWKHGRSASATPFCRDPTFVM